MKTPVELLLMVTSIEGRLAIAGEKLRMLLPADCPQELKDEIRQHKPALLDLMRLTFLILQSDVLEAIVFFASDDVTKESLVAAGAEPGSIYIRAELEVLVRQRITPKELRLIHSARQQFGGEVRNE
jgi:hypothetical protein